MFITIMIDYDMSVINVSIIIIHNDDWTLASFTHINNH